MTARTWQIGDTVAHTGARHNPKNTGIITGLTEKMAAGEPVGYVKWGKRRPIRSILFPLANLSDEARQRGKVA